MVRDERHMIVLSDNHLIVMTFFEAGIPYIIYCTVPCLAETVERILIVRIFRLYTGIFPLLLYPVKSSTLILRIKVSKHDHWKIVRIDDLHRI